MQTAETSTFRARMWEPSSTGTPCTRTGTRTLTTRLKEVAPGCAQHGCRQMIVVQTLQRGGRWRDCKCLRETASACGLHTCARGFGVLFLGALVRTLIVCTYAVCARKRLDRIFTRDATLIISKPVRTTRINVWYTCLQSTRDTREYATSVCLPTDRHTFVVLLRLLLLLIHHHLHNNAK